jgi:hypothetical protein
MAAWVRFKRLAIRWSKLVPNRLSSARVESFPCRMAAIVCQRPPNANNSNERNKNPPRSPRCRFAIHPGSPDARRAAALSLAIRWLSVSCQRQELEWAVCHTTATTARFSTRYGYKLQMVKRVPHRMDHENRRQKTVMLDYLGFRLQPIPLTPEPL